MYINVVYSRYIFTLTFLTSCGTSHCFFRWGGLISRDLGSNSLVRFCWASSTPFCFFFSVSFLTTTVPNHTSSIYQWSGNYLGIYLNEILLSWCMQNFIYPPRIQYFSLPPSIYSIRQPCCAETSPCCAHTERCCVPFALNWRVCHGLWSLLLMNANKRRRQTRSKF